MSDIDESVEQTENDATLIQHKAPIKYQPLYRQFTAKFVTLFLTMIVMIGLASAFFYQSSTNKQAVVENQLVPLIQHLKQIQLLQSADTLISQLLIGANAKNFVKLHAELIAVNRQLLQLDGSNGQIYQHWLNENKLAQDIVSRIQDSHSRNEQLKQSSVIQLKLILVSLTPIIDKALNRHQLLEKQLQAEQARKIVTASSARDYAKIVQQLNELQTLEALLGKLLTSFEQLSMQTPIVSYELLRLNAEQVLTQNKRLTESTKQPQLIDVYQQMESFEKIAFSEQRALSKWQGYIRLAQDYQSNLATQQQQIGQLLLQPYEYEQVSSVNIIHAILARLDIQLSDQQIRLILILAIGLALLVFFYSLWQLREQIKISTLQSVEIIQRSLHKQAGSTVVANCTETQLIMQQVQSIAKPPHNEEEYQALAAQYQSNQQLLAQKKQTISQLTRDIEHQQHCAQVKIADELSHELQCYQYLAEAALSLVQQQRAAIFNENRSSEYSNSSPSIPLTKLHQQIIQFQLVHEMQLEKSVLILNDINLVDEIHAILFNKQTEQHSNDNQFFINCDEQLATQVKIDARLFQQLINLLIDITLDNCQGSQFHLHVQLQDKRDGQQIVNFLVKVKNHSIDVLPSLITQLIDSQATTTTSPLVYAFNILFTKQHGDNIIAQLVDGGYQLSFEFPLASAALTNNAEKVILENANVMLLSNNMALASIVEHSIQSAKGQFEQLVRIDSFQQQVNAKYLNRHKLDLLILASDIALNYLDLITQQINVLPRSLRPKLMVLQTPILSYERFGFYSQTEQILCKDSFLHNIKALLVSDKINNQLIPCEPFALHQYIESKLPLLLAVHSPQQYQNLQRLLSWLGLQVQLVCHEAAQQALWQTGQYSLLITEFAATTLMEMTSEPLVDIAVFSLTDVMPQSENPPYCENWHFGKLSKESTLAELIEALAPWLKPVQLTSESSIIKASAKREADIEEAGVSETFMITEVVNVHTENKADKVFDFAQYLQHQGTVELALFMLDDYTQDNHQQLDDLVAAIKANNIKAAQVSLAALALNANILCAQALKLLCAEWEKVLSDSEMPASLDKVNALLKDTRIALNNIDEYAEAI